MDNAGQPQGEGGLPPGVSFDEAQRAAQGDPPALAALATRFGANKILPLQPEFIDFFVELPSDAWLALRQMMVVARVPIKPIDKKVAARRVELARAAGRDPLREACFNVAVELKVKGATFATVCKALREHEDQEIADWACGSGEDVLRRLYDSASPKKPLPVGGFVCHSPTAKFI